MGTQQRRQREAATRRKQILSAAMKLFWRQGYVKTTIPQIAAETELAPGTLYLYFASKEALYVELLMEGYQHLVEQLAAHTAQGGQPRQQASGLIDVFFDFAQKSPQYYDIMFFVLQQERTGGWEKTFPPQQIQRLRASEAACKTLAASVLQKAPGASAAETKDLIDAVWSMLTGVVFQFGSDANFGRVRQQAKKLILAGIFGRG